MENLLAYISFLILVYVSLLFIVSIIHKRNDVADLGWGVGFIIIALATLYFDYHTRGGVDTRSVVIASLVCIWGLRLTLHIFGRNKNKGEDWRYKEWREKWGKIFFLRSFVQVYLLQGFFMLLVSLPVMYGITSHNPIFPNIFDVFAITVWIIGFAYEVVGDAQLARFLKKEENKGKIMKSGLWALTRHPNYFGEITLWWGIWIFSFVNPALWWTFIGPLTINILIVFVSGVPMLEKRYAGNAEYEEYKKTVSKLIPLHKGKRLFYCK